MTTQSMGASIRDLRCNTRKPRPITQIYSVLALQSQAVVAELEKLLVRARCGEFLGMICITAGRDGKGIDYTGVGNLGNDKLRAAGALHRVIGAIETEDL